MCQDLPESGHPPTRQDTLEFPTLTALQGHQQRADTEPQRGAAVDPGEPTAEDARTGEPGDSTHLAPERTPPPPEMTPAAE